MCKILALYVVPIPIIMLNVMPPVALEIAHNIGLHAIKRIIMTVDIPFASSFVLNET